MSGHTRSRPEAHSPLGQSYSISQRSLSSVLSFFRFYTIYPNLQLLLFFNTSSQSIPPSPHIFKPPQSHSCLLRSAHHHPYLLAQLQKIPSTFLHYAHVHLNMSSLLLASLLSYCISSAQRRASRYNTVYKYRLHSIFHLNQFVGICSNLLFFSLRSLYSNTTNCLRSSIPLLLDFNPTQLCQTYVHRWYTVPVSLYSPVIPNHYLHDHSYLKSNNARSIVYHHSIRSTHSSNSCPL